MISSCASLTNTRCFNLFIHNRIRLVSVFVAVNLEQMFHENFVNMFAIVVLNHSFFLSVVHYRWKSVIFSKVYYNLKFQFYTLNVSKVALTSHRMAKVKIHRDL